MEKELTPLQQRFRYRIVASSRFLILPGVKAQHLASHALALAMRRLRGDWLRRFGYEPVLVETFVAPPWSGKQLQGGELGAPGSDDGPGAARPAVRQGGGARQVFVCPLLRDWPL